MRDGDHTPPNHNRETTLNQILQQLKGLLGCDLEAVYEPTRVGDVKHSLADVTLAKELIGFDARISFEAGLEKAIGWYSENLL